MDVLVGLREGSSWQKAERAGLKVLPTADAVKRADIVMILAPDEVQAGLYRAEIGPHLKKGAYLAFGHGFNIHFGQIVPPPSINVFMIAPKGPGHLVRSEFTKGSGVPCLLAVHQDPTGDTKQIGLAIIMFADENAEAFPNQWWVVGPYKNSRGKNCGGEWQYTPALQLSRRCSSKPGAVGETCRGRVLSPAPKLDAPAPGPSGWSWIFPLRSGRESRKCRPAQPSATAGPQPHVADISSSTAQFVKPLAS